ncbi:putative Snapin/Pallidin [Monocercomonoides exilis]|uniref:putative Snapin/Pallidin n=1 Tax=Monocercomonoides exilis TaxID=2049356 RepID=UPI00355A98B5|nr:putative Snapin/Pallidin [Monocercomonoides exilis]|eukprot:MONOS_10086.1-p1 / transcript=MONOS_10086.1 / gene=MONOS_10086 / organism=Monocercomonoides_exilis_PA203 / gene_product=unspecified product / transcript_product=unspecified product / location=Mono_scaffold00443:7336-7911(-) / protein_length=172 / sequence_SO=supercontig / SO=protein_coding / is_pseudo=false
MSNPSSDPIHTQTTLPVQQQSNSTPVEDQSIKYFKEGLTELLVPHVENCAHDLESVFKSQDKIMTELKRMETAISKLGSFRTLPKLAPYCERVKQCRKRVANLASLLSTIQGRINRMRDIQRTKIPQSLSSPQPLIQPQQQSQISQQITAQERHSSSPSVDSLLPTEKSNSS